MYSPARAVGSPVMIAIIFLFLAAAVFAPAASAVTLEDLYREAGVQRMPAIKPKGQAPAIPLKRVPVGGIPGIAIGLAVGYILEQGQNGMDYLRQQAGANAEGELPTPNGWEHPEQPPANGQPTTEYREEFNDLIYYPDIQDACEYHAGQYGAAVGNPDTECIDSWITPTPGYRFRTCPTNSTNCNEFTYNSATRTTCEAGYSLNGSNGNCDLTDPEIVQWQPDNVPTVSMSGGQLTPHPRDPDSASLTSPTSNISVTGTNEDGEPVRIDYTARPDGGLDIRVITQFNAPDGTTAVNDYRTTTNENGIVQNVVNLNTFNTSIADYAGPIPGPSTGAAPVEIAIDLPEDYARENTLQDIRNKLTVTETLQAPVLEEGVPTISESFSNFWTAIAAAPLVSAFTVSFPSGGACGFGSVETLIGSINFDVFCDLADDILPLLGLAMLAVYVIAGIRIIGSA